MPPQGPAEDRLCGGEVQRQSVAETFFGHLVDALAVREVRRVHQASDPTATLGLAEVEAEGAGVGQHVATNRLGGVAPHRVRLGVNLVGHQHDGVVHVGRLLEFLEVMPPHSRIGKT